MYPWYDFSWNPYRRWRHHPFMTSLLPSWWHHISQFNLIWFNLSLFMILPGFITSGAFFWASMDQLPDPGSFNSSFQSHNTKYRDPGIEAADSQVSLSHFLDPITVGFFQIGFRCLIMCPWNGIRISRSQYTFQAIQAHLKAQLEINAHLAAPIWLHLSIFLNFSESVAWIVKTEISHEVKNENDIRT